MEVRGFRDFQLPFYYWARCAQGDRVIRLVLIPLRDALLDVRPISLAVVPLQTTDSRASNDARGTIAVAELERALYHNPEKMRVDLASLPDDRLATIFRNREATALYVWEPYMHNPKLKHRLRRVS